jgi:hypothetical protein
MQNASLRNDVLLLLDTLRQSDGGPLLGIHERPFDSEGNIAEVIERYSDATPAGFLWQTGEEYAESTHAGLAQRVHKTISFAFAAVTLMLRDTFDRKAFFDRATDLFEAAVNDRFATTATNPLPSGWQYDAVRILSSGTMDEPQMAAKVFMFEVEVTGPLAAISAPA